MQGNAQGLAQTLTNNEFAEEEEEVIKNFNLNVRMCTESGI